MRTVTPLENGIQELHELSQSRSKIIQNTKLYKSQQKTLVKKIVSING